MGAAAVGLRAMRGGAVAVAVTLDLGAPRVVVSTFLVTGAPDDRLAYEPYTVAAELPREPNGRPSDEAAAAVDAGRARQEAAAEAGLRALRDDLATEGHEVTAGALLVNRAGWVTDLLEYSLAFADHPPVAEGLAVRDALRRAAHAVDVPLHEVDEKSVPERAAQALGMSARELDQELKELGRAAGPPWRKEHKTACLAAWLILVGAEDESARGSVETHRQAVGPLQQLHEAAGDPDPRVVDQP